MENKKVKDVMIPLSEYATVSEEASLLDALLALEESQDNFNKNRYSHRAVLVLDSNGHVIGKIGQMDVLRVLEPKYEQIGGEDFSMSRCGFSEKFMKSMFERFHLWAPPLEKLIETAVRTRVEKFMYQISEGEYIDEEASLQEGIHMIVVGHHHSLLVTHDQNIIGILRLTDIFHEIVIIAKGLDLYRK